MNQELVNTILNGVITFLSTSVGATVLGFVIKVITTAISNVKTKKYSKLTEDDRAVIVSEVKAGILEAIKNGVSVDMDAQIDKATARRITSVEKSQNEIVGQMNALMNYQRVVLSAIGDFKTISQSSKEQIQGILKGSAPLLEKVQAVEAPVLEINKNKSETKSDKLAVGY